MKIVKKKSFWKNGMNFSKGGKKGLFKRASFLIMIVCGNLISNSSKQPLSTARGAKQRFP